LAVDKILAKDFYQLIFGSLKTKNNVIKVFFHKNRKISTGSASSTALNN
jgi:hypothetical protein